MLHSLEIIVYLLSVAGLIVIARSAGSSNPPAWANNEIVIAILMSAFTSGIMFGAVGFVINPAVTTGTFALDVAVGIMSVIGAGIVASLLSRRKAVVPAGMSPA